MATRPCKRHEWRLWETVLNGAHIKFLRCATCNHEVIA
jgi:hypothetical protein